MNRELSDALTAELLAPPPTPYKPDHGSEPAWVKRKRLLQLDRDLNPERIKATPVSDACELVTALGGRICDLPGWYLDMLTRLVPRIRRGRPA